MDTLTAQIDALTKQINMLLGEMKAATLRGDARFAARCKANLSPLTQIRNRRRAELKAAQERAARAA